MNDRAFVDTNVLLYAHDRGMGKKHEKACALVSELWQKRSGVISTQILQELYVNLSRKLARPLERREIRQIIGEYRRWQVVLNTADSVVEAMEIEDRHRLSFWDALVVRAAEMAGVETLYSEDLSHGQIYGSVRVVNPFRG